MHYTIHYKLRYSRFIICILLLAFASVQLKAQFSFKPKSDYYLNSNFSYLISKITIGKDSVIFHRNDSIDYRNKEFRVPVVSYELNSIKFEFINPYLNKSNSTYQFFLEGYSENWSQRSLQNAKEYHNLPPGTYSFRLRTNMSEVHYTFIIENPIYLTTGAFILYALISIVILTLISRFFYVRNSRNKRKFEKALEYETRQLIEDREKAENILKGFIPDSTAEEIKSHGRASVKKFEMVTVLFADIHGFTKIVAQLNPESLIDELDKFFFRFDSVVEKYGIEKIKTIGDAYMCAGGLPDKNRTNPVEVTLAALEMQQYMEMINPSKHSRDENIWELRIGINSGPVISGVVGRKKMSYDIWGDTVNTASRMESSCEAGRINISETTYEFIKDFFECEHRGKMPVKYKGAADMYFVKRIKPELSEDSVGFVPNKEFRIKLQEIRYSDLYEYVIDRLRNEIPANLHYHDYKHTIDVEHQTERIAIGEGVTAEELLLLKTAALLHDSGFLLGYNNHEELSIKFAENILPKYKYTREQIHEITRLILATKQPPAPTTLLEKIICDADLDYLGREDFIYYSENLFRELHKYNKIDNIDQWNKMQIQFITNHTYFTKTAQDLRQVGKIRQLKKIKDLM